jgi:hypothetical protein
MKRKIAIFFLFTALTIVLGHNIFPHHHHEADHLSSEHHHSHEDDHHERGHGFLHLLADLIHATDDVIFLKGQNFNNAFFKQQLDYVALLPQTLNVSPSLVLEVKNYNLIHADCFIDRYLPASGLRGPPAQA